MSIANRHMLQDANMFLSTDHLLPIVLHSVLLEIFVFTVTTVSVFVCMRAAVEVSSMLEDMPV